MKSKKEKPFKSSSLRQRAEEKLKNRPSADIIGPDVDVQRLYHELQVHEVELQIREEELQLVLENAISATELFDLSPTGYFTLKPDCTITRLNRSGALMLGSERPQLIKANFSQYIPSYSRPAFQSFIQQTFGGKSRHTFETYFTNKGINRGYFQVEAVFLDYRNECLLMVIEISELKLAEKALTKSESRFKTMFDHSTVAIYETDAEGKCLLVNKQWCNFAGINEEQAKGDGWQHAIHPDDRERIFKLWDEYAQNNQPWNFEYRFCTPDQKITWVLGTAIPLKNEVGEITGYLGMNTDITARKSIEEALRVSENYYRYLVRNLPNTTLFLYDHDLRFLLVEGYLHPELNFTTKEIEGKTLREVIPAENIEAFEMLYRKTLEDHPVVDYISKFKDHTYLVNMLPVKNDQGEIIAGMVVSLDITEMKRIEEELQANYSLLRTAGETAKFGGWVLDLDTKIVKWTDQVAAIHEMPAGYSPVLDEGINFYAPECRETIINCVKECAEKGTSYDRELEIITAKGKRIWVRTTGEAVRNEKGEIVKLQGSFQDINSRKLGETALHKSEEKWRKLVNTIPDYVALYDRDGKYLFLNHFAEGFTPKDIEGKSYIDFIPDESKPVYEKAFNEASKTGETQYFEYKALGANYSIREYESFFVPIFEDNQFANMLVIARDITERKAAEHALQESEARLRELNATKDKFFSIIAHDLKNPFNSIVGFSSILADEAQSLETKEVIEYSNIIKKSSKRAMDLLVNLLDWARSQTGRMMFAPEQLDLQKLVSSEIELLKDAAILKNILIANKIDSDIKFFADQSMMGAVMRNLISNAVKFTKTGGHVVVSASQKSDELEIAVTDSGIGIKKELLGKLFHIEESLTTSGTQNERGTGLGLILCKEFIEKHGGKIWVESEVGKGSTFSFSIPVQRF